MNYEVMKNVDEAIGIVKKAFGVTGDYEDFSKEGEALYRLSVAWKELYNAFKCVQDQRHEREQMGEIAETTDRINLAWKRGYNEGVNAGYAAGYKAGSVAGREYAYKIMNRLAGQSAIIYTPGESND